MRSLRDLEAECLGDSAKFFDQKHINVTHYSICMAGELGEFCNMVKKLQRGSLDFEDPIVRYNLNMELVDLFIYLLCTAAVLDIDLEKAYEHKRTINNDRFGSTKRNDSQSANGVRPEGE